MEILAHQVNNIIQLEQVPDLISAVHQGNQPRAHLGRNCIDSIADDVVQQLIGMPRLTASLQARIADIMDGMQDILGPSTGIEDGPHDFLSAVVSMALLCGAAAHRKLCSAATLQACQ